LDPNQGFSTLQQNANSKLKQRLAELAVALEEDYDLHFELIATAALTEAADKDLAAFQKALADADDLSAALTLVGPEELQRRYEMALERENRSLDIGLQLEVGKYVDMKIAIRQLCWRQFRCERVWNFRALRTARCFKRMSSVTRS